MSAGAAQWVFAILGTAGVIGFVIVTDLGVSLLMNHLSRRYHRDE